MKIELRPLLGTSAGYYLLMGGMALVALVGLAAAWFMEHNGHIVTGMNNQIVWGLPHVFAVFLVVAASGALNVASMASVFGKTEFKPLAPLSSLLAIALLLGGLTVLMLDLGRPDRLIVAMTHFNFKSIFALNIFLYSGFMGFVIAYLWTMMEHRMNRYTPLVGLFAFLWRMALTTGTGSIFGFLVARQAYDSALLAPLFIALSLSYGLAAFILVLMLTYQGSGRPLGDALMARFARLQIIFIAAALYFVLVYHLTNLYFTKHYDFERFLLLEGGVHTWLFWLGQVLLGSVLPMVLLLHPRIGQMRHRIVASALLVVGGGFAQMYVTIIAGQAFPLVLFPGRQVSSSFSDGVISSYSPALPEWLLGFGGIAIVGIIVMVALKVLGFLPERLDDEAMQQHAAFLATDHA
ncbi:MAG: polysulfide reductase NrfD [Burkholderiales bacterium]|mgnify:CR=1 FL=1|uniref:NrfD/PsrC family molybdoenzyme membrane anchor subunit n=1 Tax=Candidatus Aalborgicola defluviihabitans TaxID=3386187 RepID=UPI001E041A61|nr:polysulfide reductase NrfD [Burkholderiales bacterium]MBK6569174.1 polysulfide reductase NrfD [Burkholderiales bacterium]